jgi:hypothetical protein
MIPILLYELLAADASNTLFSLVSVDLERAAISMEYGLSWFCPFSAALYGL